MEDKDIEEIMLMINNFCRYGESIDAKVSNSISASSTILAAQLSLIISNEEEIDQFLEALKEEVMHKKKVADVVRGDKDKFFLI